jgi:hypothetical protein
LITYTIIGFYLLRWPLKIAFEAFLAGLAGGAGLRLAGFGQQYRRRRPLLRNGRNHIGEPREPRLLRRREGQYFPWQERDDDLPDNMG